MRPFISTLLLLFTVSLLAGCASLKAAPDPTRNWSAEKLYQEAHNALGQNNFELAASYMETLQARYPFGKYAAQALLESAYAYYRNDEPTMAIAAADRFIRLHPTYPFVDYAYYLKGLVNFNAKHGALSDLFGVRDYSERDPKSMEDALETFQELVRRFPDSKYAPDSRQRIVYLRDLLAKSDINVARFYYKRDAFVAAVGRCKYVLLHYQRTPSVEDALGIQALAYYKLGMPILARDSIRVLKLNFPKSNYLQEAAALSPSLVAPSKSSASG